jgi:hypothetical protein
MLNPKWTDDPSAAALDPWQVVQAGSTVWVVGHDPAGASAIFTTAPVDTPLVVPDYVQQRYEAIARNPDLVKVPSEDD